MNIKSLVRSQKNCYLAVLQTGRWMKMLHRFDNEIYLPLKLKIIKTHIIVPIVLITVMSFSRFCSNSNS